MLPIQYTINSSFQRLIGEKASINEKNLLNLNVLKPTHAHAQNVYG